MKTPRHGSVTRERGSKKCTAGRHTLQVDILLQKKEYQYTDALFNIFTLCLLQTDLEVSNGPCEHLRAVRLFLGERAVIKFDLRLSSLQMARSEHFVNLLLVHFTETKRCFALCKQAESASKILILTADFAEIHSLT